MVVGLTLEVASRANPQVQAPLIGCVLRDRCGMPVAAGRPRSITPLSSSRSLGGRAVNTDAVGDGRTQ